MIKKGQFVLLLGKRTYLVKVERRKFSTQFGEINLGGLIGKKFGTKIKSHLGEEFVVVEPSLPDFLKKIRRAPQIITLKDAGLIITNSGLSKNSIVVEAGTGSAHLTIILAKIAKKVYSYELREDFYKVALENLKRLGIKNVVLKNSDISKCSEKNVDVFILDLGNPEKYIETARRVLKPGGYLVVYSPVIEQVQRLDLKGFVKVKTIESILREWEIEKNKTRPKTRIVGHTAFITFARKV